MKETIYSEQKKKLNYCLLIKPLIKKIRKDKIP